MHGPLTVADAVAAQVPGEPRLVVLRQDTPGFRIPGERVSRVTERLTVKHARPREDTAVLTISRAVHYQGHVPLRPEKRFSRWETEAAIRIDATVGRPWKVMSLSKSRRTGKGWHNTIAIAESSLAGLGLGGFKMDVFRLVDLLPPAPSMWDVYPLLRHYLDPEVVEDAATTMGVYAENCAIWAPAAIRRAFDGTEDIGEVTRRLFGKTRFRRDLAKAVATSDLDSISYARQLRGLVPVDWLVEILRDRRDPNTSARGASGLSRRLGSEASPPDVRAHLRTLDRQSLRNLTRRDPVWAFMRDLARFTPVPDDMPRVRDWEELHDVVVQWHNIHRASRSKSGRKQRPMTLPPEVAEWEGSTARGHEIVLARHEDSLWAWGLSMSHCIGGYGHAMRTGRSVLGGVFERGRLIANFEVVATPDDDGQTVFTLVQLRGKHNRALAPDAHNDVTAHLARFGVRTHQGARRVA